MASLISAPVATKSALSCPYFSSTACPKPIKFPLCALNPHLGQQWIGLKHMGISISPKSLRSSGVPFSLRKRRCRSMVVRASLFGVGAPEALVIGVVALLVFGPKGLAEVARNLGKTLRAFQPTIRELQDVSREFKSTLEREIGLDDIPGQRPSTYSSNRTETTSTPSSFGTSENPSTTMDPNGSPSPSTPYTSEEYLKITEEQLKASSAQQQAQLATEGESQHDPSTQPQSQGTVKETVNAAVPPQQKPENEV